MKPRIGAAKRMKLNIGLNQGLGDLQFGSSPATATLRLGSPARIDDGLGEIKEYVLRWVYDVPKLSLVFHAGGVFGLPMENPGEKYLVLIGTTSRDVTLYGKPLFGEKIDSVLTFLKKQQVGEELITEDIVRETRIDFPRVNLSLAVSNGLVSHVQWGICSSVNVD